MGAWTNEIPQDAGHQFAIRGEFRDFEVAGAEQSVNGRRGPEYLKLAFGIDPGVLPPVAEKDWPGCAEGHQAMLVKWESVRLLIEFLELGIEPMRKGVIALLDCLPVQGGWERNRRSQPDGGWSGQCAHRMLQRGAPLSLASSDR